MQLSLIHILVDVLIYGGIIGGLLAAWVVCHFNKLNFRNLLDIGAISLLLAQGIGRWGN